MLKEFEGRADSFSKEQNKRFDGDAALAWDTLKKIYRLSVKAPKSVYAEYYQYVNRLNDRLENGHSITHRERHELEKIALTVHNLFEISN